MNIQNGTEVTWLLELLKLAFPILIAWITYKFITKRMADYQNSLTKQIEDYKKEINIELYSFQTRFSLLHKEQAEVIKTLFGILVKIKQQVNTLYNFNNSNLKDFARLGPMTEDDLKRLEDNARQNLINHLTTFSEFYAQNKIFLSQTICEIIEGIEMDIADYFMSNEIIHLIDLNKVKTIYGEQHLNNITSESKVYPDKITKALQVLELEFRALLTAQNIDKSIEKVKAV